jgi:hypothetical protein
VVEDEVLALPVVVSCLGLVQPMLIVIVMLIKNLFLYHYDFSQCNGVRTKDHDFWTNEFSMIPREKGIFSCL